MPQGRFCFVFKMRQNLTKVNPVGLFNFKYPDQCITSSIWKMSPDTTLPHRLRKDSGRVAHTMVV